MVASLVYLNCYNTLFWEVINHGFNMTSPKQNGKFNNRCILIIQTNPKVQPNFQQPYGYANYFFELKEFCCLRRVCSEAKWLLQVFIAAICNIYEELFKKRGMQTSGVVPTHDNARPHSARITRQQLKQFQLNILEYPSYNPGLAPNDFRFFLN